MRSRLFACNQLHYTQEVLQALVALSVQQQALAESRKGKWRELVGLVIRAPQRGEGSPPGYETKL